MDEDENTVSQKTCLTSSQIDDRIEALAKKVGEDPRQVLTQMVRAAEQRCAQEEMRGRVPNLTTIGGPTTATGQPALPGGGSIRRTPEQPQLTGKPRMPPQGVSKHRPLLDDHRESAPLGDEDGATVLHNRETGVRMTMVVDGREEVERRLFEDFEDEIHGETLEKQRRSDARVADPGKGVDIARDRRAVD